MTRRFTELRNVSDGKLVWKAEGGVFESYGITISPDGRFVASCAGRDLRLLNAETGATVRTIAVNQDR